MGLSVIAALKLANVHPIVAADFSPRRRQLAEQMGADVVVDPKVKSPHESWKEMAVYKDPSKAPQLPPWLPGPAPRPAVIFECVGVAGVIEAIMMAAPANARIVVVGVCMERDQFEPMFGINKGAESSVRPCLQRQRVRDDLHNIAEGKVNPSPLITGKVGVEGVAQAFENLGSPEHHAKILVEPWHS